MQLPEIPKKVEKFKFQPRVQSGWKPKVVEGVERLMELAFGGNLRAFEIALSEESREKPDIVNCQDERHGNVALHVASSRGDVPFIAFLIRKRANVDVQDFYGNTPLLYAIDKRQTAAAKLLIQNGANVLLADFRGNTPLHIAAAAENMEVVNMLLRRGANPDVANHANERPSQKTTFPPIVNMLNDAATASKSGFTEPKQIMNWMGFGIGMGVGLGIALAKQQQVYHEQDLLLEAQRRREEAEIRRQKKEEEEAMNKRKRAAAARKMLT